LDLKIATLKVIFHEVNSTNFKPGFSENTGKSAISPQSFTFFEYIANIHLPAEAYESAGKYEGVWSRGFPLPFLLPEDEDIHGRSEFSPRRVAAGIQPA
jgi:hypothetical protein